MAGVRKVQVFLRGGLGNQLFQYATGLYLSEKFNKFLVLRTDLLPSDSDAIGGISRWPNQIEGFRHSGKVCCKRNQPMGRTNLFGKLMQLMRFSGDLMPNLGKTLGWHSAEQRGLQSSNLNGETVLINGYTSHKDIVYEFKDRLREELNQLAAPSDEFLALSKEMKLLPTIAIHLRQGDYMGLEATFGKVTLDYAKRALLRLEDSLSGARVWLFTDSPDSIDPAFTEALKPERILGPNDLVRPLETMVLMSKADAIVAANSTFSWWSCLLSESKASVVAPCLLAAKVNNFSRDHEPDKSWVILDV